MQRGSFQISSGYLGLYRDLTGTNWCKGFQNQGPVAVPRIRYVLYGGFIVEPPGYGKP